MIGCLRETTTCVFTKPLFHHIVQNLTDEVLATILDLDVGLRGTELGVLVLFIVLDDLIPFILL